MNKERIIVKKVVTTVLAVLLFSYIIYEAYRIVSNPVKTEVAYLYTMNDKAETEIFVVRDEKYLINDSRGTIVPVVEDGQRISKNEKVAVVFSNNASAKNNIDIKNVESSLKRFKNLASKADNSTTDLDSIDGDINSRQLDYLNAVSTGEYDNLQNSSDALRDKIITRQMITGTSFNFNKKISDLEQKLATLQSKYSNFQEIQADESGYYINNVDGYENSVLYKDVKSLTVKDVDKLIKTQPSVVPNHAIGKIVQHYDWYIVCNVNNNSIANLTQGDKIKVVLPFSAVSQIYANVVSVNDTNSNKLAVVLRCNYMNSNIANLRKESAELIFNTYTGLKVKPTAIHVDKDGNKGVYVKIGNIVRFRKVDIIYTSKDYILVGNKDNKSGYIKQYDKVIIEGTDLYDRKVISR